MHTFAMSLPGGRNLLLKRFVCFAACVGLSFLPVLHTMFDKDVDPLRSILNPSLWAPIPTAKSTPIKITDDTF